MRALSILLVEDEALIREGLRALLQKENFVNEVFEAADGREFRELIKKNIDIVLMDFRLGNTNGLDLLAVLKKEKPNVKIIMLTGLEGTELLMNLLKSGANGIVYKLDGYSQILATIKGVMEEGSYFSSKMLNLIQTNSHRWDHVPPVVLSLPERDLLKAIASGHTTKQIATLLKMSESTTETYRIRLIKKMGVLNTAGLIAYAYRNGIL
jgi:DNA-binding NarL/FixJ family response regulator